MGDKALKFSIIDNVSKSNLLCVIMMVMMVTTQQSSVVLGEADLALAGITLPSWHQDTTLHLQVSISLHIYKIII